MFVYQNFSKQFLPKIQMKKPILNLLEQISLMIRLSIKYTILLR